MSARQRKKETFLIKFQRKQNKFLCFRVRGSGEKEKAAIRVRCGDKINKMKKRSELSMCEFRFGVVLRHPHRCSTWNIEISLSNMLFCARLARGSGVWGVKSIRRSLRFCGCSKVSYGTCIPILYAIHYAWDVYHACFTVVSVSYFSNVFVFDAVVSVCSGKFSLPSHQ